MSNRLKTFWNRVIPYRWEETLSGQQYLMGNYWCRRVSALSLLRAVNTQSPIIVTIDEAERLFSKTPAQ